MSSVIFDASTIISLAMTNTLWILRPLKKQLKGTFCIPEAVKREVVDRPLHSSKFKLGALQVLSLISDGTIKVVDQSKIHAKEEYLMELANNMFYARGRYMKIAHAGEIGVLASAIILGNSAVAIDERTTRLLLESPERLENIFESKLHTDVKVNKKNLQLWKREVINLNVIRSSELGIISYELGLFKHYMDPKVQNLIDLPLKKSVLEGFLWATKLSGCSITSKEIKEILRLEGFSTKK